MNVCASLLTLVKDEAFCSVVPSPWSSVPCLQGGPLLIQLANQVVGWSQAERNEDVIPVL